MLLQSRLFCTSQVRVSQALRSGKYAAAILADREKNAGEDKKNGELPPKYQKYSNELLLAPMDYPDTVAAVFQYGARGTFARWAPLVRLNTIKINLKVFYVHVLIASFSKNTTIVIKTFQF